MHLVQIFYIFTCSFGGGGGGRREGQINSRGRRGQDYLFHSSDGDTVLL